MSALSQLTYHAALGDILGWDLKYHLAESRVRENDEVTATALKVEIERRTLFLSGPGQSGAMYGGRGGDFGDVGNAFSVTCKRGLLRLWNESLHPLLVFSDNPPP